MWYKQTVKKGDFKLEKKFLEHYPIVRMSAIRESSLKKMQGKMMDIEGVLCLEVKNHKCNKCKTWKNINLFKPDKKGIDGKSFICDSCNSKRTSKYQKQKRGTAKIENKIVLIRETFKSLNRKQRLKAIFEIKSIIKSDLSKASEEEILKELGKEL